MNRVLVVEDEPQILKNVTRILELEGFEAYGAENGRQAVERARQIRPDLIVCDIMMPEMDGFGVLETVRQDSDLAETPFIFLSARSDQSDVRSGMTGGADDYLTKPVSAGALLDAVAARLRQQQQRQQRLEQRLESLYEGVAARFPSDILKPLASIRTSAEVLARDWGESDPDIAEFAGHVRTGATRLQRITRQFLLFAHYQLAELRPSAQKPEASSLADEGVARKIRELAQQWRREGDLIAALPAEFAWMPPGPLADLVEQVVDNAFRFSRPGTRVQVSGAARRGAVLLTVQDRGWGITDEQIGQIAPFRQFRDAGRDASGLGLSISRLITRLYRADLHIYSAADEGTTVQVTIPAPL